MAALEDADLTGCLKWTFKLITFAGCWFPRRGNKKATLFYTAYSILTIGCTLLTCIYMQLAYIVYSFGRLEEMINTLFVLLTHTTQAVKVFVFIQQSEKIYELLDCLKEDTFKPKNAVQYQRATAIVNYTNWIGKSLVSLVIAAVVLFALFPLLENNTTRQLPLKGWFPFNATASPVYELMYVYLIVSVMICGCANAAMDTIAAAFMSQISIQLDILSDSIRHTKEFAILQMQEKKLALAGDSMVSDDLESEMRMFLKKCVKHHLKLKSFSANVERIFNVPLFVQFLAAVGTICTTLFEMSLVPIKSLQFAALALYQACMLSEITIFCWYGNDVLFKSSRLSAAVYNSDWMNRSHNYKKMVLFIMVHVQEELKVRVGGLVILSLRTLVSVLQSAWSYFLVLNSLHNDKP